MYDRAMSIRIVLALCAATMAMMTGSAMAHHSGAGEFDMSRPVHLRGVVASVEYANPHSRVLIDVKTNKGTIERWTLEGPSIVNIRRFEWNKEPVKAGDTIAVCGYAGIKPATRGSRKLSAAVLTMANGEKRVWENYRVGKCELDK
jgi:hypothetical protein